MTFVGAASGDKITPNKIKSLNTTAMRVFNGHVTKNPEESVAVAAGTISVHEDNDLTTIAATTIDLTAADATNPRKDIIIVPIASGSQTPVKVDGTAAASPSPPDTTLENQALAEVTVNPQDTLYNDGFASAGSWTGASYTFDGTAHTTTAGALASQDADKERSFWTYLYMKCTMKISTATGSQEMLVHLNTAIDSTGNGYALRFNDSTISLARLDSGTATDLISSGSKVADTNYVVEVFRTPQGYWNLYIDGTRIGTSSTQDKTYRFWRYILLDNNAGTNRKDWDDLLVKQLALASELRDFFTDGDYTADPVWTVQSGTWSAAGNELSVTSSGPVAISSDLGASKDGTGFIYMKAKVSLGNNAVGSNFGFGINTAADGTGNGYYLSIDATWQARLSRVDSGSRTGIVVEVISTPANGTDYVLEAIREPNGLWRLFFDGTEVGGDNTPSNSDTTYNSFRYAICSRLDSAGSDTFTFDDLRIELKAYNAAYEIKNLANRPLPGQVESTTFTSDGTTSSDEWTKLKAYEFASKGFSNLTANVVGSFQSTGVGAVSLRLVVNGKILGQINSGQGNTVVPACITGSANLNADFIELLVEGRSDGGSDSVQLLGSSPKIITLTAVMT